MYKQYDLVVIGYGMVGNIAALLSAKYGMHTAVFETKDQKNLLLSKAARLDRETLLIFEHLNLRKEIEPLLSPLKGTQIIKKDGTSLFEVQHSSSKEETPIYSFYQPDLQKILQNASKKQKDIKIFLQHRVEALEEKTKEVLLHTQDLKTKSFETISARFVLVCNGQNSKIPALLDLKYQNYHYEGQTLNVDLFSKEAKNRVSFAQNIYDAPTPVTRIINQDRHQRWEFQLDSKQSNPYHHPEKLQSVLQDLGGAKDFEIHSVFLHQFQSKILKTWHKGSIFILGDAAHNMPPYLGMGLVEGIKDAYTLIWKIQLLLHQKVNYSRLVLFYRGERFPHLQHLLKLNLWISRFFKSSWFHWLKWFVPIIPKSILRKRLRTNIQIKYGLVGKFFSQRGHFFPLLEAIVSKEKTAKLSQFLGKGFNILAWNSNPVDSIPVRHIAYLAQIESSFFKLIPSESKAYKETRYTETLRDETKNIQDWMRKHKIKFLLLRPDRIIYDAIPNQKQLIQTLDLLMRKMPLKQKKIQPKKL